MTSNLLVIHRRCCVFHFVVHIIDLARGNVVRRDRVRRVRRVRRDREGIEDPKLKLGKGEKGKRENQYSSLGKKSELDSTRNSVMF